MGRYLAYCSSPWLHNVGHEMRSHHLTQSAVPADDTEEWILPKAPKGMEVAGGGGRAKSGSKSKRSKATSDKPASDIGKASPTSAEDAEYANEIMGGSDEEYGRSSRSGSSSAGSGASLYCVASAPFACLCRSCCVGMNVRCVRVACLRCVHLACTCAAMNRSGGPREFDDAEVQAGKYFTNAADRERSNAGRRVLADATAMKNEMLSNLVLWGEDVKPFGGACSSFHSVSLQLFV